MGSFERLVERGLIVSGDAEQAAWLARAAEGAVAVMAVTPAAVRAIRPLVSVPILAGLPVPVGAEDRAPEEGAREAVDAGASVLVPRLLLGGPDAPHALAEVIGRLRARFQLPVCAPVSTPAEGAAAARAGAGAILARAAPRPEGGEPSGISAVLELLRALDRSDCAKLPLLVEGAGWGIDDARAAFAGGAYALLLGAELYDPREVTRRYLAVASAPAGRSSASALPAPDTRVGKLVSEQRNPRTASIDTLATIDVLRLINDEDKMVAIAVEGVLEEVSRAVEIVAASFAGGGRLLYVGAGTSGRLGIADAAECRPTFGVPPNMVQGLIAGGDGAIRTPVEGAEDDEELGRSDIAARGVTAADVVIGIASSGRTPHVIGALKEAKARGAVTIAIANNPGSEIGKVADHRIEVVTGPEVILGSTRMKAGTAQKMILNMISTASMIRIGKVYSNLMVDLTPTNSKLADRSVRLIMEATGARRGEALERFEQSGRSPKVAVLMLLAGVDRASAEAALVQAGGMIARANELLAGRRATPGAPS